MAFIPKESSGSLFKNDKGENAARPDYRGDCMVNGAVFEIAAWVKPMASDASKKFMSLSFKPKQQQEEPPTRKHDAAKARQLDDDVPF